MSDTNFGDIPFSDDDIAVCPIADSSVPASVMHRSGREERINGCGENTMPSNTYSLNTSSVLNARIDSIYISYSGTLKPDVIERLNELKLMAASSDKKVQANAQIILNGQLFKFHDKGSHFFKYIISGNGFNIRFSNVKLSGSLPVAYVQIASELLYMKDAKIIVSELRQIISELAYVDGEGKISRCDLCCDVITDYNPSEFCNNNYITRAKNYTHHEDAREITGIEIGMGGDIGFRLYNKTLEIVIRSKKYYMYDIWKANGWDGEQVVWRCEFEIKSNALRSFDISYIEDLEEKIGGIWAYCTDKWLRLPIPIENDHHTDRWLTHPLWQVVQGAFSLYDSTPLIRKYDNGMSLSKERMFTSWRGAITHFAAMNYIDDMEAAHFALLHSCRAYYLHKGKSKKLEDDFSERTLEKRRLFNLKLYKKPKGFGV